MTSVGARRGGLDRFADDLPSVDEFVTLGEGETPLLPLRVLASRLRMRRLSAKLETSNPTGSYKDRVAAMSLSLARHRGAAGWIATSSGNAGLAMAAYGARVGLPGFLCMVASAPLEKRLPLMPYPALVVKVEGIGRSGTGSAAEMLFEHVRDASVRHDLYLGITAHAFNADGMRGIDTIAYELAEQADDATHVYVPTGGGGLLAALARGFTTRGLTPKMIACQPAGCAPIARFLSGELLRPRIARCDSRISALQLPHPPDGDLAAEAVRQSNGWATTMSDEAVLTAQRLLAGTEGVFVEPAAAAAVAAVIRDVEEGRLRPADHPVVILTGAGWKDLARFADDEARLSVVAVDGLVERIDRWAAGIGERRTDAEHDRRG